MTLHLSDFFPFAAFFRVVNNYNYGIKVFFVNGFGVGLLCGVGTISFFN